MTGGEGREWRGRKGREEKEKGEWDAGPAGLQVPRALHWQKTDIGHIIDVTVD